MSSNWRRTSYASVAAGTAPSRAIPVPQIYAATDPDLYDPALASDSSSDQESLRPVSAGIGSKEDSSMDEGTRYGMSGADFFIPSYLRQSKFMERSARAWTARQNAARETRASHGLGGLGSRQPSSTNLAQHKSSGNRGIVQDVVERVPPRDVDLPFSPLPSRWSDTDRCAGLEVLSSGFEVKHQGATRTQDDAAAVRSQYPIPRECGIYYYEITILSRGKDGLIGVGFSSKKSSLNRLPGWELESWGYHGDDGCSFESSAHGKPYGPKFSAADTIGCGINFRTGTAFFTKNGTLLGDVFKTIRANNLYPSVGIKKPGEHVRVNFGQTPFIFDIDTLVERERQSIQANINTNMAVATTPLFADRDQSSTVQELVTQYLAHEGFLETLNLYTQDVADQSAALDGATIASGPDDMDAAHRQKIRAAILEGNIDRAFKYLGAYFPRVLEEESNRDIYFRLRCRKFVEMILRSYEMQTALSQQSKLSADSNPINGQIPAIETAEQQRPDTDRMETSTDDLRETPAFAEIKPSAMLQNDLLSAAIQYGMELQGEFSHDMRKEVKKALSDTFALIAYTDARDSALAAMVEGEGRAELAEEVNGAILVSLGKPRSALLERLCGQTEVLLDMLAEDGGPGAFVNLRRDYLQTEKQ